MRRKSGSKVTYQGKDRASGCFLYAAKSKFFSLELFLALFVASWAIFPNALMGGSHVVKDSASAFQYRTTRSQ